MPKSKCFIITIDGTSASGKGTVAFRLSQTLNFQHLCTGYIYRILALLASQHNISTNDQNTITKLAENIKWGDIEHLMKPETLETKELSKLASIVSAIPEVRTALIKLQRDFAIDKEGIILDGRDTGTVIFPDADCKFFIDGGLKTRAERRFKQLQSIDNSVIYTDVFNDIYERDVRDRSRKVAPMLAAHDATVVDTTDMTIDEVYEVVLSVVRDKLNLRK